MKVNGTATLHAPVDKVWESIMDPGVLVATIPGCEQLRETGANSYDATITAGVAAIKGTYQGQVRLSDLKPHESLLLHAEGSGAPGTIGTDVRVTFTDRGDGTTQIDYDADAVVGGAIGGVGQRMLTSASKRMANEFFANIDQAVSGQLALQEAPPADAVGIALLPVEVAHAPIPGAPRTFAAPKAAAAPGDTQGLLTGLALGAAIALVGVAVGAIISRRR